jgi:acyl-CoA dehydrogenase
MNFALTDDQQNFRGVLLSLCTQFSNNYRLARESDTKFPVAFLQAMAGSGWCVIAMP